MDEHVLEAGDYVFRVGDASDRAFVVESGRIEIVDERNHRPTRIAELGPGEIFGEMGLIDERPRDLAARALETSRLATVTREEFEDMLFHRPQESLRYLRTLFERLRAMNARASGPPLGSTQLPAWTEPAPARLRLSGLTPETERVLPGGVEISTFPYRIGRAADSQGSGLDANDLSLPDKPPYHLSRSHVSIDMSDTGLVVRDRGSYLGTVVNGVRIGGHHAGAEEPLKPGRNEVQLGADKSPFRFEVVLVADTH